MLLKRLYLKNFLCVGEDPVEIIFDESGGITVIRGLNHDVAATNKASNAAGKSTVIEGILFALYGETLRPLTLPTIPNNHTKGDCVVELEYDDVHIIRTLHRKKSKVEHKIKFTVAGEQWGTNASVPEIQAEINRVLKVNFETMCNILIFGQHNMVSFLDASEPDKREIVESLMNLAEYNAFEQKAKDAVREIKTEIKVLTETHSLHMKHLGDQIAMKAKQERAYDDYRAKLDAEIKEIDDRIRTTPSVDSVKKDWERYNLDATKKEAFEKEVSSLQDRRAAAMEALAELRQKKQEESELKQPLQEKYDDLKNKFVVLAHRKDEVIKEKTGWIDEKIKIAQDEINTLKLNRDRELVKIQPTQNWQALLSTASRQIDEAEHLLKSLEDNDVAHLQTCPTCFGAIDPKNIESVKTLRQKELDEKKKAHELLVEQNKADKKAIISQKAEIENLCADQVDIRVKEIFQSSHLKETVLKEINDQAKATEDKIGTQLIEAEKQLIAFNKTLDSKYAPLLKGKEEEQAAIMAEIGPKQRELYLLQNAKKPAVSLEQLAEIGAKLEADKKLTAEKKRARKANPYAEIIASLDESIAAADKQVKDTATTLKEREKALPYYEWWAVHFGKQGIKSYVIDQIIPTLNEQIEYWMQIIYQGAISVKFDKYLNVMMINNASRNEMIFGQGSGGERRRIDLAIMLAFRQIMQLSTGRNPSVLFFDEVAENLDEDGVYRLHDTLVQIGKSSRVFVITHNPTLLGLLQSAQSINVEKRNGVMKLV